MKATVEFDLEAEVEIRVFWFLKVKRPIKKHVKIEDVEIQIREE